MARILLTGGRAPASLDLARSFSAEGHEVFIAESQSAQVSRCSRAVVKSFAVPAPRQDSKAFVQALVKITREEKIDMLIPTCEEVFYLSQGRNQFPATCQLWVDDFEKISKLHDKWEFNQAAPSLGLRTPQSYLIRSQADLQSWSELKGRWILKLAYSRFGYRIHQGTISELLQLPLDWSAKPIWVLQEFVDGPEYCVYAIAKAGELRALSIYDHAFVAGRAGICFSEIDHPQIEASVQEYLRRIEFTGQIAFDFIVQGGQAYALECNPRATSGVHLLTSGANVVEAFAGYATHQMRAPIGTQAMLGLAMLTYALPQITSLQRLKEWLRVMGSSREVMFSWQDPVPFFDQLICLLQLCWQSYRHRVNLLAMSTLDIEWNGER